uniref:ABC-2 type transport system ATP-binding protein n=1 Tax=Candidatus Kentrum eta TaxID=2126337 RepID=A0A450UDM4_9GAMM|nr:MAG: ABC-2 type transport system ATP-binding protein [Candidatus Kentron sp. H]VFJ90593.1 MAG: ABC-2 type transport system ATP-binding protein [Candidatus Kentron sp. H]VFJ96735.1 MAG: ABC-2 type transport system ATP-binding protein [Candidatus Kentron sp. H]
MAVESIPSATALRFIDVTKYYGARRILDDLAFSVRENEFFGLIGVNGAGKSTAIKALLDLCDIDAGRMAIFGRPHREVRARSVLSFLPERFLPPYYLTGQGFLRYMARLHGRPYGENEVHRMLSRLDLTWASLAKPVRQHSKGMAQKLGLAACFLSGKPLLVLDEPLSGLDPKARRLVKGHLAGLRLAGTHTLFFSTHLLNDVEELCDRLGILHEGRLRFVGTPEQCRAHYGAETLEAAFFRCISENASSS